MGASGRYKTNKQAVPNRGSAVCLSAALVLSFRNMNRTKGVPSAVANFHERVSTYVVHYFTPNISKKLKFGVIMTVDEQ